MDEIENTIPAMQGAFEAGAAYVELDVHPTTDGNGVVPINYAWVLWGWPNRFLQRMKEAGSEVILIGPFSPGDAGTSGIDTAKQAAQVPSQFPGIVWTNEIAAIAPILGTRN